MTLTPLQASLWLDAVPSSLGPALVLFGMELLAVGGTRAALADALGDVWTGKTRGQRTVVVGAFGLGTLACAVAALRRFDLLPAYVVLLYALGRTVEGVGTVTVLHRVAIRLRGGGAGELTGALRRVLVVGFLVAVAGWFAVTVVVRDPVFGPARYDLLLAWTLLTAALSLLGLHWKFAAIDRAFPRGTAAGTMLCLTGAEVYNFAAVTADFAALTAGSVAYTVGFWVAVHRTFRR